MLEVNQRKDGQTTPSPLLQSLALSIISSSARTSWRKLRAWVIEASSFGSASICGARLFRTAWKMVLNSTNLVSSAEGPPTLEDRSAADLWAMGDEEGTATAVGGEEEEATYSAWLRGEGEVGLVLGGVGEGALFVQAIWTAFASNTSYVKSTCQPLAVNSARSFSANSCLAS